MFFFVCKNNQSYDFFLILVFFLHSESFGQISHEKRRSIAHLASVRQYFLDFLRRPDSKQELIDEFQNKFNKIHPDLRREDETKEELHLETSELSHNLFQHSMNRKNEAVSELEKIKQNEWLEMQINAAALPFVHLIQTEFNRHLATVQLIKDYYAAKSGQDLVIHMRFVCVCVCVCS